MLSAVFLVALLWATTAADVIYVDDDASAAGDGTSWGTAYKYLQDALADANSSPKPVEIWVSAGTYYPDEDEGANVTPNDRTETFQLIDGVALYGGFAGGESSLDERDWQTNETILSGDLNGDDVGFTNNGENSYHVVTGSGTNSTAVLDGFTITAGNDDRIDQEGYPIGEGGGMYNDSGSPKVTNCAFSGNSADEGGGGMYNVTSSNANVTNCTFSGNTADYYGGGMHNSSSSPTVTNCTFSSNSTFWAAGGMFNEVSSSPELINCIFSGNSALDGGGMCNWDNSSPTLTNCTFSGNSAVSEYDGGGGMCNWHDSNPTLTNCTFSGNSAFRDGGGMYNSYCSPTLTNCTFIGNHAYNHGGGMYNYDNSSPTVTNCVFSGNTTESSGGGGMCNWDYSRPRLTNCTFSGNSTDYRGGGMYNGISNPTLTNCIFWGNTAPTGPEIYNNNSTPTVTYSDIAGGYGGTGNIPDDPLFVDADGPDNAPGTEDDNLRLSPGSPCIDAGDNTAVPADTVDLDNDANTTERIPLDLNAFARFIDDLCTTDTGVDDLPEYPEIVDMGAYEFLRSDIDSNGGVNLVDFAWFAPYWQEIACGVCGGADLTCDGNVDYYDLNEFTDNYLLGL